MTHTPQTPSLQQNPSNILLVGFMTSGKSTVGRYLARKLHYHFLDTDHLIETTLNMPISKIFAQHGEAFFRKLEASLLERLPQLQQHVIATGGGMPATPQNIKNLKQAGTVVYLAADLDSLIPRLQRDKRRPLLNPQQTTAQWQAQLTQLFEKRQPFYAQAHLSIKSLQQNSANVAADIYQVLLENGLAVSQA